MKTLVVIGHPKKESFSHAISNAYIKGTRNRGDEVRIIDLATLKFNPHLYLSFESKQELEEDLKRSQEDILWADHLVFIYPIWWSLYPAVLKGFIDRVFLPGFSFEYKENGMPNGLLKGKTSSIIATADSPNFYRRLLGDPAMKALKRDTLKFCGIKTKNTKLIGGVRGSDSEKRKRWLEQISDFI